MKIVRTDMEPMYCVLLLFPVCELYQSEVEKKTIWDTYILVNSKVDLHVCRGTLCCME